jgi:hypothetical protein
VTFRHIIGDSARKKVLKRYLLKLFFRENYINIRSG